MNKMFDYPMNKYRFYSTANKVVAVSTYEGRTVRGVAKADPRDEFDIEKGKMLAAARCNAKVAQKRAKRASREYQNALGDFIDANEKLLKMRSYHEDAKNAQLRAIAEVNTLLAEM